MQKILNSQQIKDVDRISADLEGIQSIDLMERASLTICEELMKELDNTKPVYVFAGPGNNGGDALAVARMLLTFDIKPKVFIVGDSNRLSADCSVNKDRLSRLIKITIIESEEFIPIIPQSCSVLDGLFGSGLNRPLNGIYAKVIHAINDSEAKVYSIDIPSGLFVENNSDNIKTNIVKAHTVFTLQMPKLSLLLPESAEYCQNFKILDIGLSSSAIDEQHADYYFLEKRDAADVLMPRNRFAHKGNFGHAFLLVGSMGKMGAAVLASKACLRAGVGLLSVHVPQCGCDILQITAPEAMLDVDISETEITQVDIDLKSYTIGMGCGIGTSEKTRKVVAKLLSQSVNPMVIDADALNIIAADDELKQTIPENSILTPHPIEFERLVGERFQAGYTRLQHARDFANKYKVHLVLKGAHTAIIAPNRKVYFNSTGNAGMATGGSGDSLTGILTSLLAQKYKPIDAALLGVYLHGFAGDLAKDSNSLRSLLPSDLIECIGKAYCLIES